MITNLQMQTYLCIRDFRRRRNKKDEEYGWSIAVDDNADTDTDAEEESAEDDAVQTVTSTLSARQYPDIEVEAGKTAEWTITVPEGTLNGCNDVMYISEYGIQCQLKEGENVITFTPEKTGSFQHSCWMGMITGTITVT